MAVFGSIVSGPVKNQVQATRKAFFAAGFCLASWAPLIPLTQRRLHADSGTMGMILLAFGLGSMLMMPLSGMLASRYGCRRVFTLAVVLALAMLPALVWASSPVLLGCSLFLFGAGIGAMDVVVNIHAVITEKRAGIPIMSGFHALFSLGGVGGAGMASAALAMGAAPIQTVGLVALVVAALTWSAWHGLLDEAGERGAPHFVLPHGSVILLGGLCCIAYVMEGSMLDWSGILLTTLHGVPPTHAGLGYTLFVTTMTLGRFTGDKVVIRLGQKRAFIISALLATAGLAALVLSDSVFMLAASFLLVGLGLSNIAPMLFTASGRQTVMPDALAVSAVSTMGYSGILMGPAVIGGLAHILSLTGAFACVALLSTMLVLCVPALRLD